MPSGLKRLQKAQCLHFIAFSCFHRFPLLEAAGAREAVEAVLEQTRARHQGRIYAYVLMPEHVHLLVNDRIALDRLLAGESVARGSALAERPTIMLPHPSRKGRGLVPGGGDAFENLGRSGCYGPFLSACGGFRAQAHGGNSAGNSLLIRRARLGGVRGRNSGME